MLKAIHRGWEASCDGRGLGAPQPVDGYAMAWHVSKSCRDVSLAFAPNRLVTAAEIASLAAALGLVALLLVGRRRKARAPVAGDAAGADVDASPRRLGAGRAALLALVLAPAFGFIFAARATPLFALGLFVILWRAIPTKRWPARRAARRRRARPDAADPGRRPQGYDPEYAGERIAVHWVAAAAVAILIFSARGCCGAAGEARVITDPAATA